MIIDFHTHAFPDRIVGPTMEKLVDISNLENCYDGSIGGLKAHERASGADAVVVLNIASKPRQHKNVNDFAADINKWPVFGFGSVYPKAPDAMDELNRIKALGLKGIKFHADYQDFFVDDPACFPLYERIAELGLITVFHSGIDAAKFEPVHCTPKRLFTILPLFKNTPVIAAHLGGNAYWGEAEEYLVGKDIYFDTTYDATRVTSKLAERIIRRHGAERILLGSDAPWGDPAREVRRVKNFKLPTGDIEKIMGLNAQKLLGIDNQRFSS